jgi:hypothetical protein
MDRASKSGTGPSYARRRGGYELWPMGYLGSTAWTPSRRVQVSIPYLSQGERIRADWRVWLWFSVRDCAVKNELMPFSGHFDIRCRCLEPVSPQSCGRRCYTALHSHQQWRSLKECREGAFSRQLFRHNTEERLHRCCLTSIYQSTIWMSLVCSFHAQL